MLHRTLILTMLVAGAAHAQNPPQPQPQDIEGEGDVDGDDWQAMQPPAPDDPSEYEQYPGEQQPQEVPTQQQFEQQLSPYGAWYDEPGVGRVWQPSPNEVGSEFMPYTTGGSWGYTNAGWQFAPTYRFGSVPYHYGRWYRSPRFGWVWQPQYQWGASWVDWRCNRGGNVAWAPMGPRGYGLSFSYGAPHWSYAYGRYHRPMMSSFSWGRYGGWHNGRVGGYHAASPVYSRGGYAYHGGGSWHSGGGGGWRGGGGWHGGGGHRR